MQKSAAAVAKLTPKLVGIPEGHPYKHNECLREKKREILPKGDKQKHTCTHAERENCIHTLSILYPIILQCRWTVLLDTCCHMHFIMAV